LEDVPTLAEHLLARIAKDRQFEIDPEALQTLTRHQWPGNVRELYHALERAYLIGSGRISADHLALESQEAAPASPVPDGGYQAAMDQAERQLLESALKAAGGNKTAAAAALGMKPSTFRDRLAKHGLG
jgi:DNA-binding NtrC family response regulator